MASFGERFQRRQSCLSVVRLQVQVGLAGYEHLNEPHVADVRSGHKQRAGGGFLPCVDISTRVEPVYDL